MKKKTIYCIDGNAYVHRAYHGIPMMTNSKGQPTNAVYGFTKLLERMIREGKPDYIVVCFDSPKPTFRHKEYNQYKATRKPTEDDLRSQFPLVCEVVKAMNVGLVAVPGYEADDIIATLCSRASNEGLESVIVTGDKDAYQLVNASVSVYNEQKGILYDKKKVIEKTGVEPGQFIDLQALMGDSADNVPGVRGVGEKTAVPLIQQYGSLDNVYENLPALKDKVREKMEKYKDDAYLSKKLVTLIKDVPIDNNITDFKNRPPDREKLLEVYSMLGFKSMIGSLIKDSPAAEEVYEAQPGQDEKANEEAAEYRVITAKNGIEKLALKLSEAKEFSFVIMTDNESPMKANIAGMAFSLKAGEGYCIPFTNERKAFLGILKPVFEDSRIIKCCHGVKKNTLILNRNAVKPQTISFDSEIASYLLDPEEEHDIESISEKYLNYTMPEQEESDGQLDFSGLAAEKTHDHSCNEADVILRLAEPMQRQLKEKGMTSLFSDIEMPLAGILAEMEEEGILIDEEYLLALSKEFAGSIAGLEKKIYELADQEFNINSPKQLSFILFEKLNLPVISKTKTGYSTAENVLVQLSAAHELPGFIMKYRELQKLKSTYVDALPQLINSETGRIHSSFNQTVTATGRLSSSEPNLQNIPVRSELGRRIRAAFIPKKGCSLVSADYSQIDLRALAHISEDKNLLDSFGKGQDIHTRTASEIFNVSQDEVTKDMRRIAKVVNFGLSYGMGPVSLARDLNIPVNTAKAYIATYFKKYSGVKKYITDTIEQAGRDGFVSTVLNRRRYLPGIKSNNRLTRNNAEKMAINTPVQGTSSDIIKVAMINISRRLKKEGLKSKMLVQIHDELLFEAFKEEEETLTSLIKEEMEACVKLKIPLIVELGTGKNWMEIKK